MDNSLAIQFDPSRHDEMITRLLYDAHQRLAQLDRPSGKRSSRARNYDSAIRSLKQYMMMQQKSIPSRLVLEGWRDDMLDAGKSVRTVNARLSAVRQLLHLVADETSSLELKVVIRDWLKIPMVKEIQKQDALEQDYGTRLTLPQFAVIINSIPTNTPRGLRDRALIALMGGCGLRVSEACALTIRDVFMTINQAGDRGINVRRGKHDKQRVVVVDRDSWVFTAVKAYTDHLRLDMPTMSATASDRLIFSGKTGKAISTRTAQRAVEQYGINAHDLRRTYARLCRDRGMSWEALRENMGHSTIKVTEAYVGKAVNWSERIPEWSIPLKS
ncbi:MAG TPA: site-specific integrase [Phototrophicaceae bacterium]|jgi:site-specific recombinase XerD|nr:site-specific integrase [Phototrophicaceae bacterium]